MNACITFPISEAPQKSRSRQSILCVDDSPEILEICQVALEAVGYKVFTADNGKSALELLKANSINAAIIDNMMPGMNGLDLASNIKSIDNTILVIMFSSSFHGSETMPFVDFCLPKGSGPVALRRFIDILLQK